ncbi:hypothetical protein IGB42_00426 [Andreprevotia sp. IGB-42]|nr:hypothetical protein IGB42_00426 [Andreprevotia sp. IGB-42]
MNGLGQWWAAPFEDAYLHPTGGGLNPQPQWQGRCAICARAQAQQETTGGTGLCGQLQATACPVIDLPGGPAQHRATAAVTQALLHRPQRIGYAARPHPYQAGEQHPGSLPRRCIGNMRRLDQQHVLAL